MPIDAGKIAQLEKQLADAKAQLLQEDGKRYQILMREMSEEEKRHILDRLTDKQERMLFGLEVPEEPTRKRGGEQPGKSGGDLVCEICGKAGLTKKGLALHKARVHKEERPVEAEAA
jgi:hypothetical protein